MKTIATIAMAALMTTSVSAIRCGDLKITQCLDMDCSKNCTESVITPAGCGNDFLGDAFATGSVGTTCDSFKANVKFYSQAECKGDLFLETKEYMYDICYSNEKGSMKLQPTGNAPEYFEITEEEYEERFYQRFDETAENNVLGYGPFNKFVPPLLQPTWLVNEIDRWILLIFSNPLYPFFSEAWLRAVGTGQAIGGYWYNNAFAAGSQLYPTGLSKYFDLYSWPGYFSYLINWTWSLTTLLLWPFTLLPLNVWFGIFAEENMDGVWKAIIPFPIIWIAHLRGENGWMLA